MFKLHKLLAFFSFFIGSLIYGQSISGIVMDKNTKESIPFATVSIGDYGVITNNEGQFQLNISRFTENDSLLFSNMGHQKFQIALKDYVTDTIYLSESINELDQVYLLDRQLDVREIMEKVVQRIPENYDNSFTEFTVFERKKGANSIKDFQFEVKRANFVNKKTRKEFNHVIDSLKSQMVNKTSTNYTDVLSKIYIGEKDSLKLAPVKATYLINREKEFSADAIQNKTYQLIGEKLKNSNTFKVKSGWFKASDSLDMHKEKEEAENKDNLVSAKSKRQSLKWVLRRNSFKNGMLSFVKDLDDYEYKVKEVSNYNEEIVYVISFVPDRRSAKFTGELFVSAETFAVVKADYALVEGKTMDKVNLKLLFGVKTYTDQKSGTIIYQKNSKNKYVPKYIKNHSREYVYINRPFSFKENNDDRSERIKMKFKVMIEQFSSSDTEMLFVESKELSPEAFAAFEETEGVPLETIDRYDANLWKDYNIISPDQAIREYEF